MIYKALLFSSAHRSSSLFIEECIDRSPVVIFCSSFHQHHFALEIRMQKLMYDAASAP